MYGAREAAPEDQTAQPATPEAPPATAPVQATPEDTLKAQLQEFGAKTVPAKRIAKLAGMTPEEQIAHLDTMDLENSKAAYAEGLAKYRDSLKENTDEVTANENQGAGAERPAPEAAVNAGGAEQPVERPTAQPVEEAAKPDRKSVV